MGICKSDTIQCMLPSTMYNILLISFHRLPFASRARETENVMSSDPKFQPSYLSPFILEGSAAEITIRTVIISTLDSIGAETGFSIPVCVDMSGSSYHLLSSGIHACFSPDGDHIIAADYNHAVVLDIERGKKLKAQGSQISLFTMVVIMG